MQGNRPKVRILVLVAAIACLSAKTRRTMAKPLSPVREGQPRYNPLVASRASAQTSPVVNRTMELARIVKPYFFSLV